MGFDDFLSKILGNDKYIFNEVHIKVEVIEEIILFSMSSYPNEFVALLEGEVKDKILIILGLILLPGTNTSSEGATVNLAMIPNTSNFFGSVHSHPGYSNKPSYADLQFFYKDGFFHMIICEPFTVDSIQAYNAYGEETDFTIVS